MRIEIPNFIHVTVSALVCAAIGQASCRAALYALATLALGHAVDLHKTRQDRLSKEAIARDDRLSREAIALDDRISREMIAREDRIAREAVAQHQAG
jgi:transcriptional regulator of met regulon